MNRELEDIERRAGRIKLLLMDCDGVLTDGRLTLLENGDEQKTFNVRDGHGLVLLHRAGLESGIISGRKSSATERRAKDLGISYVIQNSHDKIKDFDQLLASIDIPESQVAFIGDDVTDIPLMQRAELAVAVADATEETRHAAHCVTAASGGYGAVREVAELILKAQGRWTELMARYIKG
jgi:3-deoxy-D-manno-octulosonate 8-phosphate phosphatase (KDO 8-P phosphatase)